MNKLVKSQPSWVFKTVVRGGGLVYGDNQRWWTEGGGGSGGPLLLGTRETEPFTLKMWVCSSAPVIIGVNKLPAADPDLTRSFWVVCLYPTHSAGLIDKEVIGLRVCRDQLAQPSF